MIFKKLPIELKKYIRNYIFHSCEYCTFINYYWNLKRNVFFYEYRSIFHDFDDINLILKKNPVSYNLICDFCFELHNNHFYSIQY